MMTNLDKSFDGLKNVINWINFCENFFSDLVSRKAMLEYFNVEFVNIRLGSREIELYLEVGEFEIRLKANNYTNRTWSVAVTDPKTGEWIYSPLTEWEWWFSGALQEALDYINNRK